MNNKGFAITGIIYGLLVLFLLTFASFLSILSSKKNRLESLTNDIYNTVDAAQKLKEESINEDNLPYTTVYSGNYVFEYYNLLTDKNETCSTYLSAGTIIRTKTVQESCFNIYPNRIMPCYTMYTNGMLSFFNNNNSQCEILPKPLSDIIDNNNYKSKDDGNREVECKLNDLGKKECCTIYRNSDGSENYRMCTYPWDNNKICNNSCHIPIPDSDHQIKVTIYSSDIN